VNIQRILVIEDDALLSRFIETHLKRKGHLVTCAECIADAKSALNQNAFDLIISDIRFPDGDGIEFLRNLRKDNHSVLHITMTGYGSVNSAVEAMRLGSSDYLVKPFTGEQLDVSIERLESWKRLANENDYLRQEENNQKGPQHLLGDSEGMKKLKALIDRVATTKATVLIQGESGTGKELIARAVWMASPRKSGPFIKLNCAAVPEHLMESELFGHEKGAFTGAINRRDGRFQMADMGTLLLDEISEIPLALQAKLLRVLQESEFERVGSNKTLKVDVRILATTNRDLKAAVEKGEFREDLFYRLKVFPLHVPPLRERREDIEVLVNHYLQFYATQYGKPTPTVDPNTMLALKQAPWKGNVRELQNAVAHAVILSETDYQLGPEDFGVLTSTVEISAPVAAATAAATPADSKKAATSEEPVIPIERMEKQMIEKALVQTNGNKTHAARLLGISVRTLRNKLHEYRLNSLDKDGEGGEGVEGSRPSESQTLQSS
jgi:DNA-binding NtrC family response regulator